MSCLRKYSGLTKGKVFSSTPMKRFMARAINSVELVLKLALGSTTSLT
jgi:hypothetical protein